MGAGVDFYRPSECKSLGADPDVGIDNACFSSLYVRYRNEDQLRDDFQKIFSSALGAKVVSHHVAILYCQRAAGLVESKSWMCTWLLLGMPHRWLLLPRVIVPFTTRRTAERQVR